MNNFTEYWQSQSASDKRELAEKMDSSYMYLSQIANGHRRAGKNFARVLSEYTGIPVEQLRG